MSTAGYASVEERVERGRAARRSAPRSSHAELVVAGDRPDPVDLLERQALVRIPELVRIRYGRMLASPFTFYRGTALIMATDLAHTPTSGLVAQLCGDAHLSNFGLYASPERRLVFDINDFDETLPGPFEWDVKRLAVSMLLAARAHGCRREVQDRIVLSTVRAYREQMREFATMGNADVWYTHAEMDRLMPRLTRRVDAEMGRRLERLVERAVSRDSRQAYSKLATVVDGVDQIVSRPPLVVRLDDFEASERRDELRAALERFLREYGSTLPHDSQKLLEQYQLVDVARKVVGVGSVGTGAWIVLMIGLHRGDPLFLQIKEAQPSVLEEFAGTSRYPNAGERVVAGQRIMQSSSDIFLGWLRTERSVFGGERDYYVRQLRDWKGSVAIERMDATALKVYGRLCGDTLAQAHARSGDRVAIASYLGRSDVFERAVLEFSRAYAEQNDRDYGALRDAVSSGRIDAQTDI